MRMRPMFLVAVLGGWVTTVYAEDNAKEGNPAVPPTAMAGQLITASAKVKAVDMDKHELTLEQGGKTFNVNVPDDVSHIDNVKPGDTVRLSFYESVAVSLEKPGEARVGTEKEITHRPATGDMPGGMVSQRITTTAKITKIEPGKDELTIKSADGKMNTIKVQDPEVRAKLDQLKVGDKIQATYTQAMATSFTAPKHM